MSNDGLKKILASVEKLHGGDRDQRAKYDNFVAWQIRERQKARGIEPSSILKVSHDDPHDAQDYEAKFGIPL